MAIPRAVAPHSFAAEFDVDRPITLKGVVQQIDWTNPHVWFYVHVKDDEGKNLRWACEMGAPHQLQQRGWLRDTMKVGDVVTVAGSLARDGRKRANARTVTTADGKTLGAASSGEPCHGHDAPALLAATLAVACSFPWRLSIAAIAQRRGGPPPPRRSRRRTGPMAASTSARLRAKRESGRPGASCSCRSTRRA